MGIEGVLYIDKRGREVLHVPFEFIVVNYMRREPDFIFDLKRLGLWYNTLKKGRVSLCQKPPVRDGWHVNATLRVVFEHCQNSTSDYFNHSSKTSGILKFKIIGYPEIEQEDIESIVGLVLESKIDEAKSYCIEVFDCIINREYGINSESRFTFRRELKCQ